jgi:hypothetical protein
MSTKANSLTRHSLSLLTVTEELPQNTVCLSVARDAGRLRNVRPHNCGCCSYLCLHIDGVFLYDWLVGAVKEGYEDGCSVFNAIVSSLFLQVRDRLFSIEDAKADADKDYSLRVLE